ncbi:hypothetical protein RHGRI_017699 [Rhododendron griersonianum]|uniref:Uncharacterized protein n=1 Tax=Rhododendron griersonianum TaxID=479676 RepID=A0AAV6JYT9_9ERIC|nr:hypothetical protein RHGRI_017699 [Rhododendron griersonianum]
MEKALLGGESSGGLKSTFSSWRDESAHFLRRSDAISYGSLYQKAAALVDLAEDGVGLPEQILDQSSYETAAKLYFIYVRLDFLWALNYFALIVLNFFEKPMWCHKYSEDSCSNREYYFLGELPYLTGVESLVYEGVTVIILVLHTFFPISYEGFRIYWKSPLNKLKLGRRKLNGKWKRGSYSLIPPGRTLIPLGRRSPNQRFTIEELPALHFYAFSLYSYNRLSYDRFNKLPAQPWPLTV